MVRIGESVGRSSILLVVGMIPGLVGKSAERHALCKIVGGCKKSLANRTLLHDWAYELYTWLNSESNEK
jgi:hypothetical protein